MLLALVLSIVVVFSCVIGILLFLLSKQKAAQRVAAQRLSNSEKNVAEVQAKLGEVEAKLTRYSLIESVEAETRRLTKEADANVAAARAEVTRATAEASSVRQLINSLEAERLRLISSSEASKRDLAAEISTLKKEQERLSLDAQIQEFGLYEPKYQFPDSPRYKQELDKIYGRQKEMIKTDTAARCDSSWTVEGSQARGRRMVEQELKMMLLAFNGECDALISKVRHDNLKRIEERIEKLFEKLNKLGSEKRCYITKEFLSLKIKELYLTHEYAEKKQLELEEQRAIREQMREEEKAQRELERAQMEAEREAERCRVALEKAQREAEKSQGLKLDKLTGEIERLTSLLTEANARKERAVSQAQLTRSGYVYIISNIGSFGEEVYKVGMTRRLDPMDRVYELGDASVPFPFDVHAMIYSEDAPRLEALLHRFFDSRRVNLANTKKEFFRVKLDDIRGVVEKNHAGEVKFTLLAEAAEYRRSETLRSSNRAESSF